MCDVLVLRPMVAVHFKRQRYQMEIGIFSVASREEECKSAFAREKKLNTKNYDEK